MTIAHERTFFGVVQRVFQSARSLEYVWVVRVVVALADDLDATQPEVVVHVGLALPLHVLSVPAPVVALDHLRGELAPGGATHAAQLGNRGGPLRGEKCTELRGHALYEVSAASSPSSRGHLVVVEGQDLDVLQQDFAVGGGGAPTQAKGSLEKFICCNYSRTKL